MTLVAAALVTRCPKCATAFRVSASQLQSAKGMVRCGSCLKVFYARDHEVQVTTPEPIIAPQTNTPVSPITRFESTNPEPAIATASPALAAAAAAAAAAASIVAGTSLLQNAALAEATEDNPAPNDERTNDDERFDDDNGFIDDDESPDEYSAELEKEAPTTLESTELDAEDADFTVTSDDAADEIASDELFETTAHVVIADTDTDRLEDSEDTLGADTPTNSFDDQAASENEVDIFEYKLDDLDPTLDETGRIEPLVIASETSIPAELTTPETELTGEPEGTSDHLEISESDGVIAAADHYEEAEHHEEAESDEKGDSNDQVETAAESVFAEDAIALPNPDDLPLDESALFESLESEPDTFDAAAFESALAETAPLAIAAESAQPEAEPIVEAELALEEKQLLEEGPESESETSETAIKLEEITAPAELITPSTEEASDLETLAIAEDFSAATDALANQDLEANSQNNEIATLDIALIDAQDPDTSSDSADVIAAAATATAAVAIIAAPSDLETASTDSPAPEITADAVTEADTAPSLDSEKPLDSDATPNSEKSTDAADELDFLPEFTEDGAPEAETSAAVEDTAKLPDDDAPIAPLEEANAPVRQVNTTPKRAQAATSNRDALIGNIAPAPVVMASASRAPLWKNLGWAAGCVLALAALIGQYTYRNFDQLALSPEHRPTLARACAVIGCELPSPVDISAIESVGLAVRAHPDHDNILMVDANIVNRAGFSQPFPKLTLMFSDINGTPLASRTFTPAEYLAGELAGRTLMPQKQPVRLAFDIVDPGPDAVNYQLLITP